MDFLKKQLKEKYKSILFYVFLFIIILVCNLATNINADETWSYGFSHNIYKGLRPYLDFNMVITPFHPFIMSLPFHIFGSSIFLFEVEHTIIMLLIIYLIKKIINNDNSYIIISFVFLPLFFIANYNTFLFLLFCFIVYLEKFKANDYLIGLILGIVFLTKQSIGILMLLPSLFLFFKQNKIKKRIITFILPIIIFLIYLIITNSLLSFLDLCFFGLFDFASKNSYIFKFSFILTIIVFIIALFFVIKNKNNITGYYALIFFIGMVIPIFDYWHLYYGFCAILLFIISLNERRYLNEKLFFFGIIIFYLFLNFNNIVDIFRIDNKLMHFRYKNIGLSAKQLEEVYTVNEFLKKHKNNIVILSKDAYFLKICNDIPIGYTDLINTGNFGYKGTDKLIKRLKGKKNTYFLIDRKKIGQIDRKAINYIIKNSKKVRNLTIFEIFYK